MFAIEIRRSVSSFGIKRIVSVEEKTRAQTAAFIEGMRVSIGGIHHQAMGHSLRRLKLQGVVGGDALSFPEVCVGIEADVRRAQRRVSVGKRERSDRGLNLLRKERAR